MTGAGIMLAALAIDAAVGWPAVVFAMIGHPVTWLGRLITRLEKWLNLAGTDEDDRRLAGVAAALLVIVLSVIVALVVQWLLPETLGGLLVSALLAWPLLAARSLFTHVAAVARPLASGDLTAARAEVAKIVGRDPARLDEAGVARAALESLAENASDGVIAPLFWGAIFGLPGIAAYKAINTLDSMIGHKTPRHLAFGWAAARIDDVANLIPARLTGLLFAATSPNAPAALACMVHDAGKHRSPNAGWPEAALAASLGVRLSGPRVYDDHVADEPWINGEAPDPGPGDLERGLRHYRMMILAAAAILAVLWLV
ncbi:MAG: cobalamin biosynthesis protein CobD [Proteobacteria bacterium]|nr:cobalamin biosynthesis protein CobD [Pseudomonadota bacterium]MBS0572130.1 cobalamin biosynthesis protein CobD [Pseudomonadota bacterium]